MTTAKSLTKDQEMALKTLDNMEEIVRNEMMRHVGYLGDEVDATLAESGAICGGLQACAIGSMILAHPTFGRETRKLGWGREGYRNYRYGSEAHHRREDAFARGVANLASVREEEYEKWPGLSLAHDALNMAADEYMADNGVMGRRTHFPSEIEQLFESAYMGNLEAHEMDHEMLGVIERAKEIVLA